MGNGADRASTSILIGGQLSEDLLQDLCDAIETDNAALNWEGTPVGSAADLLQNLPTKGPLTIFKEEALFGQLDEIEMFCRERGLTYVRSCDATGEFDAELVWWMPGMTDPVHRIGTKGGNAAIAVAELRAAISAGTPEDKLSAVSALIEAASPPEVPPLRITPAAA